MSTPSCSSGGMPANGRPPPGAAAEREPPAGRTSAPPPPIPPPPKLIRPPRSAALGSPRRRSSASACASTSTYSGERLQQLGVRARRRRSVRRRAARPGRPGRSSRGGGRRSASCGPRISTCRPSWICLLDLHVDGAGGVVEDQDRRVDEQRARDRDALALAARQRVAALADDRVVAVRQLEDELLGAGRARRRADLLERRVGTAVGDVVADRDREQERLVEDDADLASAGSRRQRRARRGRRSGRRRR